MKSCGTSLNSLSLIPSRSIYGVSNGKISFFLGEHPLALLGADVMFSNPQCLGQSCEEMALESALQDIASFSQHSSAQRA